MLLHHCWFFLPLDIGRGFVIFGTLERPVSFQKVTTNHYRKGYSKPPPEGLSFLEAFFRGHAQSL